MKKILLISSDEAFLARNRNLFNRSGFLVLTARSSQEALLIHSEHRVHLMVASLDLPDRGADELCFLIRQDSLLKNVSIILVCFPTEKALQRASGCGANAWLTKPVHPMALLEQAAKFLRIAERLEHRVPFRASVHGMREAESFSGVSRNISASGILCETEVHLEPDELIRIRYQLGTQSIETDGKVVRAARVEGGVNNYGVQFLDLDPDYREGIESFISASAAQG